MASNETPAYNLKVVLRETGLTADTLRAWERRYGIPKPQRTPGGHRLYSQRDIQIIKWLKARQTEGLSISHAVDLWNELIDSDTDPLADSSLESESSHRASPLTATSLDELRNNWIKSCLDFDESASEQLLQQAFAVHPVEYVSTHVIQRGLSEIGELWYRGEASVQQEHFASGLVLRRLVALIAAAPAPTRTESILLACPAEEWHTLPLVLLQLLLRRRGFPVIYLGANVPLSEFEKTMDNIRPNLIVLAAQQLVTAATLKQSAVRLAGRGHQIAFGGNVFNRVPALRGLIRGHFLGEELEASIEQIEDLAKNPRRVASGDQMLAHPAAQRYREARPRIELGLTKGLQKIGMSMKNIRAADYYFGNALAAALELGDPAYLTSDLDWIRSLLIQHIPSEEHLNPYLQTYARAIRSTLGPEGEVVATWIDSQTTTAPRLS